MRLTESICQSCFQVVSAWTFYGQDGSVKLHKDCPACGQSIVTIEPDSKFYNMVTSMPRNTGFQDTVLLNVTNRCNMSCAYCYHPKEGAEPTIDQLLAECLNDKLTRVTLTGGEPTVRPDLVELIKTLQQNGLKVSMLTNGMRLADPIYLESLANVLADSNGFMDIGMSIHPLENQRWNEWQSKSDALNLLSHHALKIFALFYTVSSFDQLPEILDDIQSFHDQVQEIRVRWPFANWAEQKTVSNHYLSEIYQWFYNHCNVQQFQIVPEYDNNPYHITVKIGQAQVRLIACPDKFTNDLAYLRPYGPRMKAQDGKYYNFIQSLIVNEGMRWGWQDGRRLK